MKRIVSYCELQDDRNLKSKHSALLVENFESITEFEIEKVIQNWDSLKLCELVSSRQEAVAKTETSSGDRLFMILNYGFDYKSQRLMSVLRCEMTGTIKIQDIDQIKVPIQAAKLEPVE
jgi:hypothetical protein